MTAIFALRPLHFVDHRHQALHEAAGSARNAQSDLRCFDCVSGEQFTALRVVCYCAWGLGAVLRKKCKHWKGHAHG